MTRTTIKSVLAMAARRFAEAGIEAPRREAATLLSFTLARSSAFLIAHPEYELSDEERSTFLESVARRAAREPYHYITGTKEFYGLEFNVGPGVLIPRPETELLVEEAIEVLSAHAAPEFLEVGVGSGCISISILHGLPNARATGIEVSECAFAIAAQNAAHHNVEDRFDLRLGDLYRGVNGPFDMIASNPPYIPDTELSTLQADVRDHEPHIALFGGNDGLAVVRQLIDGAPKLLNSTGAILFEIGAGQSERVKDMFTGDIWRSVEFIRDLQGIPRVSKAIKRN